MFRKKKNKDKELEQESADQLNQDLIVHNMPSLKILSGAFLSPDAPAPDGAPAAAQPKHKKTGLFIMIGGLVLIAAIAYGTYYFMIAPMIRTDKPAETVPVAVAPITPPAAEPVETAVPLDLSTTTPVTVSVASTTATTTEGMVNASGFKDSDNDGLNDEEEAILGTTLTSADSDSDTYPDSAELLSGYNPIGGGKISNNANLVKYSNEAFKYETLYPKDWPVKDLNDGATAIFSAPDGSLIQISVQDNPEKASILSWYEDSFPNITVTYDKVRSTYSWEGIMGETGLNFYLVGKDRSNIFVVSYIPAEEGKIAYPNIFQLMINSLFLN
jgi:hypothetical protein